jgi:hypothetical protein
MLGFRLEVYCGTDRHTSELGGESPIKFSADPNSGPAAVCPEPARGAVAAPSRGVPCGRDRPVLHLPAARTAVAEPKRVHGRHDPDQQAGLSACDQGRARESPAAYPARHYQNGGCQVLPLFSLPCCGRTANIYTFCVQAAAKCCSRAVSVWFEFAVRTII